MVAGVDDAVLALALSLDLVPLSADLVPLSPEPLLESLEVLELAVPLPLLEPLDVDFPDLPDSRLSVR